MLLRMLNGISFFPRVITKATSLFKSTTPGQGSWILLLPTALSLPPPTPNHQPAPNVCIYLCIRAYEFLHNIIGDHPVPSTLIIIVPSSLCISDNSCIYLRSQPCIPFSSSRNCINALPYSKSLVANIYSEGSTPAANSVFTSKQFIWGYIKYAAYDQNPLARGIWPLTSQSPICSIISL